jgi:uncharacterized cupredoxin-like copper-binding protein
MVGLLRSISPQIRMMNSDGWRNPRRHLVRIAMIRTTWSAATRRRSPSTRGGLDATDAALGAVMTARDEHTTSSAPDTVELTATERHRRARRDAFSVFSATLAVVAVVFAIVATWASVDAQDSAERSSTRLEHAEAALSRAPRPAAANVTQTSSANPVVQITELEFHITSDHTTVPHGRITFTSTNAGTVPHELVVMKTDNPPNRLPIDTPNAKAVEDGQGDKDMGEVEDIAPGSTKSNTLTLPAGHYVLLCNLPGHYLQGMWVPLTLT